MSLFKWFSKAETNKQENVNYPESKLSQEEKDALELKFLVEDLLDQLGYISTDTNRQHTTRLKAIKALGNLGSKGFTALPHLLKNCFKTNAVENKASLEAMKAIDQNWAKQALVILEVPFLITQLKKDQRVAIRAASMLQEIGLPAKDALFEVLKSASADAYQKSNVVAILGKMDVDQEQLAQELNLLISSSENPTLLEACVDAIAAIEFRNQELLINLTKLLEIRSISLIIKTIKVLEAASAFYDFAPSLITCLTDQYQEVREAAIQALSIHDSPFADEFYQSVLKNKGEISSEELLTIAETKNFWKADSSIFEYRVTTNTSVNSMTWHQLYLKNSLHKPIIQLESVLTILVNKKFNNPDFIPVLEEIVDKVDSQKVYDLGKELLACM